MSAPIRILYMDLAPFPGGSVISLAHLVGGLDRARWQPMVVLSAQNGFAGFEGMGVPVARVRTPQWERLAGGGEDEGEEMGETKSGSVAAFMRSGRYRRKFWRMGGEVRHWQRDVLPVARALRPIIRAFQPQLIHLNDAIPLVRPGILAARWTHTPVINHSRSFVLPNALDRRWLLPSLQGMIFISEAVARAQLQGISSSPATRVIPNPVDLAAFQQPVDRGAVRRELGIPEDAPLVGMVGRLVPWKGQHIFIEALARLQGECPRVHGLIVGDADSRQGRAYKNQLLARSRELGVEDRLHWAGHRTDLPRVLAALDALAHCSVEPEPFGRVIIEGMAAGVPVVGSRAGGVVEIIEDGVNGLLTRPGDAEALARALARLLNDPPLRETLAENGRRTVIQRYTVEAHVRAVTRFYEALQQNYRIW